MRISGRSDPRKAGNGRTAPRRRPRRNVSRRAVAGRRQKWLRRLAAVVWAAAGAAAVVFVSVFFVFMHDVFTQSDYFKARDLQVEGMHRVSARDVLSQAGIREGVNVLSVNLSAVRKRLMAHPWVADAQIRREIPSSLRIRIREHEPAAVVDLGRPFLMNEQGELFKEFTPSDPQELPRVTGLAASDLRAADRSDAAALLPFVAPGAGAASEPLPSRPLDAVLQVLSLGRESGSILPARLIREIRVDRELGLTVVALEEGKTVRLGYDDYPHKYRLLADLLTFFREQPGEVAFERVDLSDVNRVIVNPVRAELPKKTGPQGG
jgi:cell division protein FtsQ